MAKKGQRAKRDMEQIV